MLCTLRKTHFLWTEEISKKYFKTKDLDSNNHYCMQKSCDPKKTHFLWTEGT